MEVLKLILQHFKVFTCIEAMQVNGRLRRKQGQKSRIRFVFVKCSLLEVVVVEFKFHLKGIIVDSVDAGP